MINSQHRCLLFLLFFIFPYLFFGCGGKDNSTSDAASGKHIPQPKPQPDPKPKPKPDPKPEPVPTSKLMITASQTNAMLLPFTRFNLGLVNIKFTVIPEGKDKAIDVYLYPKTESDANANQSIDIDLTSLQDNQYMLVDTMEIPTGTITAILISFSGANTHIAWGGGDTLILVDPFLSGYSAPGDRVAKIRKTPAEVFIKTHIELTRDKFEYISMEIDKTMTAGGIDPYFLPEEPKKQLPEQHYMQFVPTVTINTLPKDTDVELVIINEHPLDTNNSKQTISDTIMNTSSTPINLQTHGSANHLTENINDNDQNYALLITTLSTKNMPSLAINTIGIYATKEKRSIAMEALNSQYQSTSIRPDKEILMYRDTFNEHMQANSFSINSFKVLTTLKTTTSEVIFSLPQETYLLKDAGYLKVDILPWVCDSILYFTNLPTCDIDAVKTLKLPLDEKPNGHFIIVESGRINLDTLTILPDIIHAFNSSDAFYKMLKDKLEHENALVAGLEIDGEFNNNEFTVTNGMKVTLLSQEHNSKLNAILDIMIGTLGSVAILSQWLHGKSSMVGHQTQGHAKGTP